MGCLCLLSSCGSLSRSAELYKPSTTLLDSSDIAAKWKIRQFIEVQNCLKNYQKRPKINCIQIVWSHNFPLSSLVVVVASGLFANITTRIVLLLRGKYESYVVVVVMHLRVRRWWRERNPRTELLARTTNAVRGEDERWRFWLCQEQPLRSILPLEVYFDRDLYPWSGHKINGRASVHMESADCEAGLPQQHTQIVCLPRYEENRPPQKQLQIWWQ